MPDRVVITGMGVVNPIGLSLNEAWQNMVNGVSGIGPITLFDTSDYLVKIACEVKGLDVSQIIPMKEARRRDRYQHFAAVAADEAIRQSGLEVNESESGRVGVIVSSAIGGLRSIADNVKVLSANGPRRVSPFMIPMLMSNGAAGLISIDYGYRGPSFSVASACASGADGIGMAWYMIKSGIIDVAIAGGSDAVISEVGIAAFDRLGAMSRQNGDHPQVPRPFDLNRDGLVMGEGASVVVLESEEYAKKRGAEILAELAGYAGSSDAYHITAPSEDGIGGARALHDALFSAGLNKDDIGYVNAHGTATPLNDISETRALKAAFGDYAYQIPISSTKSMTGHMMGSTAAFELVACAMAVRENVLPPTINYETPDPECDLDYIPNAARETEIHAALSNAFGFGGHNAVLVVKEYS